MKANILNIQKSSIHDGPGIRTVVYFKGCPLRCPWCRNPESQSHPTDLLWDRKKCFHGHLCELHCPTKSLNFKNDLLNFNHETCTYCRSCVIQCPTKALEFAGKMMELDEVMDELLKEKDVFDNSGGGVTLSGGEVLNQPEVAAELLKKCREAGIHTTVITSGYASPLVFSKVIRLCDLLLFDIKHHDAKEHVKYMGVSPGKILENLDTAVSMDIPLIVTVPIIPGVTSTLEDAKKFAQLLKMHRVKTVCFRPFHHANEEKYEILNMNYQLKGCKSLCLSELEDYFNIFRDAGLNLEF